MFSSLLLAVAIVAHDPGYNTSLANHLQRWLKDESIAAKVVTPKEMESALAGEKIAFLVGFSNPTDAEMAAIGRFSDNGGKLVVFHSAARRLATLMGVRSTGYSAAPYPGAWSKMCFKGAPFEGCPELILQTSGVLNRIAPIAGRSKVIATWADRTGKISSEPAWIESDRGWWMSHVLLADGDEDLKARLAAAMCGSVDPSLWNYTKYQEREKRSLAEIRAFALKQVPKKDEIRAVWDHSGCGLYPGNWAKTIKLLRESRVTDLFVNVAGAGFAHYASSVLPQSRICTDEGDQLAACLKAASGSGIRIHVWFLTFSASRSSPSVMEDYAKRGWRLRNSKGALTEYVDPGNGQVQQMMLSAIDEVQAKYPEIAGVHLDFIRYGESAVKPSDAVDNVSGFVAKARLRVKRPCWFTTAVYGKYPRCVNTVAQDWEAWLDARLVDYVVPMDYCEKEDKFVELLVWQSVNRRNAAKTIVGIGVTANESRLGPKEVIRQINLSRKYGFAGVSLFDLDTTLEKNILPYLRLGIW